MGRSLAMETPFPSPLAGPVLENADMNIARHLANTTLILLAAVILSGCATMAQQPSGDPVYCHGMKRPPGWICADPK